MYSNESYLIELLTQAGYLNEEILQYARSQKSPTQDLVDFLIQANYLTEDVIAQVAASNSLLPVVDLGSMHIPQEVRAGTCQALPGYPHFRRRFFHQHCY